MSIRERLENNIIYVLLGALTVGFLAGLAAYHQILEIAQLTPVPRWQANLLSQITPDGLFLERRGSTVMPLSQTASASPQQRAETTQTSSLDTSVPSQAPSEATRTAQYPTDTAKSKTRDTPTRPRPAEPRQVHAVEIAVHVNTRMRDSDEIVRRLHDVGVPISYTFGEAHIAWPTPPVISFGENSSLAYLRNIVRVLSDLDFDISSTTTQPGAIFVGGYVTRTTPRAALSAVAADIQNAGTISEVRRIVNGKLRSR